MFIVNTTADTPDANPGNGVCADSSGRCSLRAAIMEANALGGPHTIVLQSGQTYTLSLDTATGDENAAAEDDLDITATITIQGNGATIETCGFHRAIALHAGKRCYPVPFRKSDGRTRTRR
ncbi:MAG: CSLREA domain-containing protein [Thermoflexia bacterium]|nr:MAG: CSLREA domain-containing protein [Thermoflexia bacterium]